MASDGYLEGVDQVLWDLVAREGLELEPLDRKVFLLGVKARGLIFRLEKAGEKLPRPDKLARWVYKQLGRLQPPWNIFVAASGPVGFDPRTIGDYDLRWFKARVR